MAGEVSLTMEQITVAVREGVAQATSSTSVTDIVSAGSALALVLLTGVSVHMDSCQRSTEDTREPDAAKRHRHGSS